MLKREGVSPKKYKYGFVYFQIKKQKGYKTQEYRAFGCLYQ
jgi:hypothetical protein